LCLDCRGSSFTTLSIDSADCVYVIMLSFLLIYLVIKRLTVMYVVSLEKVQLPRDADAGFCLALHSVIGRLIAMETVLSQTGS